MDYSDFIILLARQRSGTNATISVLRSHKDILRITADYRFGAVSGEFLSAVSTRLDVPVSFVSLSYSKRYTSLFNQTVENFSTVETAPRGTRYEYCLEDEASYHGSRNGE